MKNIMHSLKRAFGKKKHMMTSPLRYTSSKAEQQYPVTFLEDYLGDLIEIHYLDFGAPQILQARLFSRPTPKAFYISFDGSDMNIVYWNTQHADGRISSVKMIKHRERVLYINDDIPFDYEVAEKYDSSRAFTYPVRRLTREYLQGAFG